ncbi:MAG TPA: SPFH domain-containing protein [Bacteroidetes bacterium]|nr:SPFH domain-containing protein [Bacteroidota bacterium]
MKNEKDSKKINGYIILLLVFVLIAVGIYSIMHNLIIIGVISLVIAFFILPGFTIVNPNESMVMVLFGDYKGTLKDNGFWWVNPFMSKKKISLRARNFNSEPIKVNDKIGNPIMIGAVVVWRVRNTFKAAFEVDDYEHFVRIQTEAAIRKLAGMYPYDNLEDEDAKLTLREGGEEVNKQLENEVAERLKIAGIEILEGRINYLAYATEIASAMLKRQQAVAIIAARTKIVEGAVTMVEMALEELSSKQIVHLDEERKAQMVSNLMVVLTSDKDVSPVVNTGSLY